MKIIELTQNKLALVDDADFPHLNKFKWHAFKRNGGRKFYAARSSKISDGKFRQILMHTEIMKTPKGKDTDHIDGFGLNNQKHNLRVCTRSQNLMNQGKQKSNTSGFKGVSWHKGHKRWGARIYYSRKNKQLGYFKTKTEAYEAYCLACEKYHGEFAKIS